MTRGRRRSFPARIRAAVSTGSEVVPLWKGGAGSRVGAWPSGVGISAPGFLRDSGKSRNLFECDL